MKTLFYKYWLLLLFVACAVNVHAQDDSLYIDSLKKVLATQKEDTNKVNNYFELGYFYQWTKPDSALFYALPGLALAKKLGFKKGEYDMILPVSESFAMKGNYARALESRLYSIELAKQLNNPVRFANALALTGNIYLYSKDYRNALKYLYKAQSTNNVDIGGGPKIFYTFFGQAYFHLQNLDSAFFYINKAYELDLKEPYHWSVPYQYLAAIYEKKGDFSKAIKFYNQSFNLINNTTDKFKNYNGIASVYNKIGRQDSAIFYAKKAVVEGSSASIPEPIIEASELLSNIYKSMHESDSALKYKEMLLIAKDSLFSQDKIRQIQNVAFDEQMRQDDLIKEKESYQNKVKQYALIATLSVFIFIGILLWRNNRSKQKANILLKIEKQKVEGTLLELKSTQAQLIQSEKMASLGELTAGIAHEIQNPLNFVNNFSEVNKELIEELSIKNEKLKIEDDEVNDLLNDLAANEEKINHHGKRADAIVKGMLQHSRSSIGEKEPTDINALCDEYLRLSYQGMRAKEKSFNADFKTDFDESIGKINIVPQDIGRVLLNLYNNAFYAVNQKQIEYASKELSTLYEPTVSVATKKEAGKVLIIVSDNGNGIPQNIVDKIFQPFFTTKPTGQGTGLGLSLSYDIVKAHGGEIRVKTEPGEGTGFIIYLPV